MTDLWQPANAKELELQILRDIRLAAIDAGATDPPVEVGSDWQYLASAVSNVSILGFANIAKAEEDTSALTATGDALDNIRQALALPEVPAVGATGKIKVSISGNCTLTTAHDFVYPNGERGRMAGTTVNPADGDELAVVATSTGTKTNLKGGQIVRFRSPPVNCSVEAMVSYGEPLTGGTDAEKDDRKRDRILNVYRYKPSGQGSYDSWARIRQFVLDSLGSVQDCYPYPALGGPGSDKIVIVKDFDPENLDYSRAMSTVSVTTITTALHLELGIPEENVVQTVANQNADFTVLLDIPNATLDGGTGLGWLDAAPWPQLEVADSDVVTISAVASTNDQITVTANTATAPIAGVTRIAWWSPTAREFKQALVTAQSGSAGAWVLTLDRPLVDRGGTGPSTGDYISPAAQNLEKYGDAWVTIFRGLGPGENTSDADRLPRAKRHPFATNEDPFAITNAVLAKLARDFTEITDYEFGVKSPATPTVPASVATAPNILVPRHLAIYSL